MLQELADYCELCRGEGPREVHVLKLLFGGEGQGVG